MQKSMGFSSLLTLGGAVGLLAVTAPAQAQITNGSFETNSFSGWTFSPKGVSNDSSVVTTSGTGANIHTAVNGTYYARLRAGTGAGSDQYTTLSQSFTAGAGQTITGSAFFQANGQVPTNDDAYVQILQGNIILFSASISTVGVGNSTPWTSFFYDFTGPSASYTIQAAVRNVGSTTDPSAIGLDNVAVGLGSHAGPNTPEGSSLFMLIAGGLPFAAVPLLRRKRK